MSRKALSSLAAIAVIAATALAGAVTPASAASGPTYYVNCTGSANGSGTQASPWNSTAAVNALTFQPGDSILFARGTTCAGHLAPQGSGSSGAPITIGSYGTGALPTIAAGSSATAALELSDQSYWTVEDLRITGGIDYGVYVTGNTAGAALTNIDLSNLDVSAATGTTRTRGDSGEVYVYPRGSQETISKVVINGVTAHDANVAEGIFVGGAFGAFPPGTSVASPGNTPIGSSIMIENSSAYSVAGDGILLTMAQNSTIQNSVAHNSGACSSCGSTPSGLWEWYCQHCTLQYDESYDNHTWAAYDGGAFDIDNFDAYNVLQYDYGHDNDGYCLAAYSGSGYNEPGDVFRYNVCSNNERKSGGDESDVELSTDPGGSSISGLQIYNNTFYFNPADGQPFFGQTKAVAAQTGSFENNLVYSTTPAMTNTSTGITFDHNLYYTTANAAPSFDYNGTTYTGLAAYQSGTGQDAHSLVADPLLNLAGDHGIGFPTLDYTLAPRSPAFGAGTDVCSGVTGCSMGARDFFGNPVTTAGTHNIGADDSPTAANVVADAGFESGGCAGWACYLGASAVSGHARSGSSSVQLPPNSGAEQTISGLSPNSTYTLTGWGETSIAGQCALLGVKSFDSSGAQDTACLNTTAYTRGSVTFTTGPTNTSARIFIYNPSGNTATAWGDDLAVNTGSAVWTGKVVSAASGKCLDLPNSTTTLGTQTDIRTCGGGANQQWTHTAANAVQVYSGSTLACLDDLNSKTTPGAPVGIWTCDGGPNQQWIANPNGTITSALSGLCLDVTGNKTADGTGIELWTCSGGANQKWSVQ